MTLPILQNKLLLIAVFLILVFSLSFGFLFISSKKSYNRESTSIEEKAAADLQKSFPPAKKFTVLKVDEVLSAREFVVSDNSDSFTLILSPSGHMAFLIDSDKKDALVVGDLIGISADYAVTNGTVITVDTIIVQPSNTGLVIDN